MLNFKISIPMALLAATALAAPTPARIVGRAPAAGGTAPLLVADGNRFRMELGGRSEELLLPVGADVDSTRAVGSGWVVAGSAQTGPERELFFVRGGDQPTRQLSLPRPVPRGSKREGALLFAEPSQWSGVAWVEGTERQRYEVRFAPWTGDGFGPEEVVAPRGPGSQLALAGVRLGDGRLLLVWAGYDGQDDEIWAALRSQSGGWSLPIRIGDDNSVPDITPDVVATRDGALVSWCRYDGSDYRVALARFDGRDFADIRLAGPPGSLFPTFEFSSAGGTPTLLYRDALSSDWVLTELDAGGGFGRSARAEGSSRDRPAVEPGGSGPKFRFGGRSADSTWQ